MDRLYVEFPGETLLLRGIIFCEGETNAHQYMTVNPNVDERVELQHESRDIARLRARHYTRSF